MIASTSTGRSSSAALSPPTTHDYTEGASTLDISAFAAAAASSRLHSRRDSLSYDTHGAVFDGPGHVAHPSSVTRMSYSGTTSTRRGSRRRQSLDIPTATGSGPGAHSALDRRRSLDSALWRPPLRRGGSLPSDATDAAPHPGVPRLPDTRRRPSHPAPSSVLDGLTHLFARRSVGGGAAAAAAADDHSGAHARRRPSLASTLRSQLTAGVPASAADEWESDPEAQHASPERWGYSSDEDGDGDGSGYGYGYGYGHTDDSDDGDGDGDGHGDDTPPSWPDGTDDPGAAYDSYPPSPPAAASLPLLPPSERLLSAREARFGADALPDAFRGPAPPPPPPGPPSRQTVDAPDEGSTVRFVGYEADARRALLWRLGCTASAGALGLASHWFPRMWLRWVAREKAFKHVGEGFVVVETTYDDVAMFPLGTLSYPFARSTVFPSLVDSSNVGSSGSRPSNSPLPAVPSSNPRSENHVLKLLRFVDYRYSRFVLDPTTGIFNALREWRDPSWVSLASVQDGLQDAIRRQRLTLFGSNEIDIQEKSIPSLLVEEIIHPFYVFQIASMILWCLDDYYYYAFCIGLISVVSIMTTLIDTRRTIRRMREISRFSCDVSVFVDGAWTEQNSTSLVPGDIIRLSQSQFSHFPADMFLLSGDAIVNESMLTGESVPVSKIPATDGEVMKWKDTMNGVEAEYAKCFLHFGTKVVRIRGSVAVDGTVEVPAIALVLRTGFNTTKGALTRSMLFPKPIGFKFYRDSIRFICVLAAIAGLAFCASSVQFIRLGIPWQTIILRALDLVTVVVPPALPASLSIGTGFALSRLRKVGIFCISPNRVNVGGKVNVCCFDKTGTLTEDGLDILGVRSPDRSVQRFGELVEDVYDLPAGREKASFLHALATCHSLKTLDGHVIGDPLDVKMFEFTRWTLEESRIAAGSSKARNHRAGERPAALVQIVVRPPGIGQFRLEDALRGNGKHAHFLELGVIRTFEFVSSLRRMSVVVKRLKSNSMEIYVKGAPEVMSDICERESFPDDYDDLLSYYTKRGYRVIAMAGKTIEGLSWLKAQKMRREQAETGLRFLGLIIFENKLKPGSAPAIQALRTAHIVCKMITGDNPLTAVSVARECSLINQTAHVFAPTFVQGNANTSASKLEWSCTDDGSWKLESYNLKPLPPPPHHTVDERESTHLDYSLVVTGDVFRWMIHHAPPETLQSMFIRTQIFARMSPDEKNEVVERLQSLGYSVLMCGDGANDCAALKAADVGISLSEAEASVAAPFTSSTPDISCVIEVIKEGRAALVTSFSCFKYMALYSLIQFTTITLLYSFASSLGDLQFLYIDLFIIIPIAVAMGRTLPYPKIYIKRPTASLVSNKVLSSIIGQVVITSATQGWAFFWVRLQPWYEPPHGGSPHHGHKNKLEALNFENSVLFLVSCFQYILAAAVFSIGPPFRRPMWTNGWLVFAITLLTLVNLVNLLAPAKVAMTLLELMNLPTSAKATLLMAVMVNAVLSWAFERWGADAVSRVVAWALRHRRTRKRWREAHAFKRVTT